MGEVVALGYLSSFRLLNMELIVREGKLKLKKQDKNWTFCSQDTSGKNMQDCGVNS